MIKKIFLVFFLWWNGFTYTKHDFINYSLYQTSPQTYELTITFEIPKSDFLYQDYLKLSVDSPHIALSPIEYRDQAESFYDPTFKESKNIFKNRLDLKTNVTLLSDKVTDANIHIQYYLHSKKKINTQLFDLIFPDVQEANTQILKPTTPNPVSNVSNVAPFRTVQKKKFSYVLLQKLSAIVTEIDLYYLMLIIIFALSLLLRQLVSFSSLIRKNKKERTLSLLCSFFSFMLIAFVAKFLSISYLSHNFAYQLFFIIFLGYFASLLLHWNSLPFKQLRFPEIQHFLLKPCIDSIRLAIFPFYIGIPIVILLMHIDSNYTIIKGIIMNSILPWVIFLPLIKFLMSGNKKYINKQNQKEMEQFFGLVLLGIMGYFISNIMAWYISLWIISWFVLYAGITSFKLAQTSTGYSNVLFNVTGFIMTAGFVLVLFKAYQATETMLI